MSMMSISDYDEGIQSVFGYVVITDRNSNRFYLNKSNTKFSSFNEDTFSFFLGKSKDYNNLSFITKKELKNQTLQNYKKAYNIFLEYEGDISIEDNYSIEALPSCFQKSNESIFDL